ncbi:MAG TPA: hypothetical protein VE953_26135 [Terriglobales bacterium]|nr:hypothetical protein [Terriglobales bacterium]
MPIVATPAAFALYGAGAVLLAYGRDAPAQAAFDSAPACAIGTASECRQSVLAVVVDHRAPASRSFAVGDPVTLRMADGTLRDVSVVGTAGPVRIERGVAVRAETFRGSVVSFADGQGTAFTSADPDRVVGSDLFWLVAFAVIAAVFGGLTARVLVPGRRLRR